MNRQPDYEETITPERGLPMTVRYWFEEETAFAPDFEDPEDTAAILARQERGEPFAWYGIACEVEIDGFTGEDHLGGCNEADGATIEDALRTARDHDMVGNARTDLVNRLRTTIKRGTKAESLLFIVSEP